MKNVLRRAALAVATVAAFAIAPMAVPAPASAAVTGTTSSDDAVLYPQCQLHDVDYSIQTSGTSFWSLEMQIESPSGLQSGGVVLSSTKQSPNQGTVQFTFCGSEEPGTWIVKAGGAYQLGVPAINFNYTLPDSTFDVRSASTRTALKDKLKRGTRHRYKLIAVVRDERADGFDPTEGAPVEVQRLVDGSWQKVRGSRERSIHGRTTTYVRAARGERYRAVTQGLGNYSGSVAEPITIQRQRR